MSGPRQLLTPTGRCLRPEPVRLGELSTPFVPSFRGRCRRTFWPTRALLLQISRPREAASGRRRQSRSRPLRATPRNWATRPYTTSARLGRPLSRKMSSMRRASERSLSFNFRTLSSRSFWLWWDVVETLTFNFVMQRFFSGLVDILPKYSADL